MNSLFVSVHFDDAVFSAGKLISVIEHPTVLTIFGGMPENKTVCTAYDQKSGFNNAEEAVLARRDEDAAALSLLGADQRYLEFVDNQYGQPTDAANVAQCIIGIASDFDEIYLPLGFMHPDHALVGSLFKAIAKSNSKKRVYVYMDMPYYVDDPIATAAAFDNLPYPVKYEYRGGDLGKKMLAIACYKSQVPITNLYHLMADERFYVVE